MQNVRLTYGVIIVAFVLVFTGTKAVAQPEANDSVKARFQTLSYNTEEDAILADSIYRKIAAETPEIKTDSVKTIVSKPKKETWKPKVETSTWLALVIPGGGQIYNRKYWKLPIVYGGFVGCMYAYNWNGQMYKDYRQAYLDIMDSDPNTDSFKDFFRPGYNFEANKEYLKNVFKNRKDRYRRWRDMSIFAVIGVYALSVIDAYVDAQLSRFDISEDINVNIEPQVIQSNSNVQKEDFYGFNCQIKF